MTASEGLEAGLNLHMTPFSPCVSQVERSEAQSAEPDLLPPWPDWDSPDVDSIDNVTNKTGHTYSSPDLCGMLVQGSVDGVAADLLVDTGASTTLLSEWFFTIELGQSPSMLTAVTGPHLVGAGGRPLDVVGSVVATVAFDGASCRHRVTVVRGLQVDGLLGRDILGSVPCSVASGGDGRLHFSAGPANVSTVDSRIGRVVSTKKVLIPPRHEVLVPARVRRLSGRDIPPVALLETLPDQRSHWMVASALIQPDGDHVFVRMVNTSSRPVTVRRKSLIGTLSAVEEESAPALIPSVAEGDSADDFVSDRQWDEEDSSADLWQQLTIQADLSPAQMEEVSISMYFQFLSLVTN